MIYLRASSKEVFDTAIREAGWVTTQDDVEFPVLYSHTHSVDVIGNIHAETGETITIADEEGDVLVNETALIEGYHANVLLHGEDLPSSLEPLVIPTPNSPHRRFS